VDLDKSAAGHSFDGVPCGSPFAMEEEGIVRGVDCPSAVGDHKHCGKRWEFERGVNDLQGTDGNGWFVWREAFPEVVGECSPGCGFSSESDPS
jgi:hypothetical protein